MRKLWQMSKDKMGEESIKSMISHKQKRSYSKHVNMRTRGRGFHTDAFWNYLLLNMVV